MFDVRGFFVPSLMHCVRGGSVRRWLLVVTAAGTVITLAIWGGVASAAQPPVGLGTATSFAVLAGSTVTNTGPTTVSGDLGVSPGSAVTGFPPGQVINGTMHIADAVALQAQNDLTTAYNDAAGRTPAIGVPPDLGGLTLVGGGVQHGGPDGPDRYGHP
ncbi:ice-binding family protein [Nocardia abscessus]|uniref:ice-binding family protein n=1 Tax=Nocardia abscessus TaxID=120957 RepID=UPI00313C8C9A